MHSAGGGRQMWHVRGKIRAIGRLFALSHTMPVNLRLQVEAGSIVRRQDSCVMSDPRTTRKRSPMNVLTVFAHPGSRSFCHAVLDRTRPRSLTNRPRTRESRTSNASTSTPSMVRTMPRGPAIWSARMLWVASSDVRLGPNGPAFGGCAISPLHG